MAKQENTLLQTYQKIKTARNAITVTNLLIADIEDHFFIEARERPELQPYAEAAAMIAKQMAAAEIALRGIH